MANRRTAADDELVVTMHRRQTERFDALPSRDVFAQPDDARGDRPRKAKLESRPARCRDIPRARYASREIGRETRVERLTKAREPRDVRLVEQPAARRRHVEQQLTVPSDGAGVEIHQVIDGAHALVL